MKKLLVALVILLVLGAAGFIVGWVQVYLPAGSYGVLFTKTGGWDTEVTKAGTFSWRWERLLPTNATLLVFHPQYHEEVVSVDGQFPSGEIYRTVLEDDPDFNYLVEARMRLRVKPEALPRLAADEGLRPDELEEWTQARAEELVVMAADVLTERMDRGDIEQRFGAAAVRDLLLDELSAEMPDVEISRVTPLRVRLPDIRLYRRARELYEDLLAAETDALRRDAVGRVRRIEREEEIQSLLREYGAILEDYPSLIEYFGVEADPLRLQRFIEEAGIPTDDVPPDEAGG